MKKKKNTKAAASAVAAVTAAGVIIGGSFSSPADIMDGGDAIVQSYDGGSQYDDDDGSVSGDDEGESKHGTSSAIIKRFMMQAPEGVRTALIVPLWLIGTGVNAALSFLFSALLSPLVSKILSWAAVALLAYLMYILSAKLISPDTPLKKLVNRRSLALVPLVCAAFALLDCLLPVVWEDYEMLAAIVRCCVFTLCASIPTLLLLKRRRKAAASMNPDEAPDKAERLAESRKLVMELADTVCPGR